MFHPKKEQKKTQQLPENHGKQKKKEMINTAQYQIQSNRVEFICSKEGISSKPRGIDKMQEEVLGSSPNRDKNKKKKVPSKKEQKKTQQLPENHGKQKRKEMINVAQYQIQSNRVEFISSKEGISSKPRVLESKKPNWRSRKQRGVMPIHICSLPYT